MRRILSWRSAVLTGISMAVVALAIRSGTGEEGKSAPDDTVKTLPTKGEGAKSDPFAVPDGDAATLVDFIGQLMGREVGGRAEFDKLVAAIVKAADKVLAGKPDATQTTVAVNAKLQALAALSGYGDAKAKQQMAAFIASIGDSKVAAVQALVKRFALGERLRNWNELDADKKKALVSDVVALVEKGPVDPAQFELVMRLGQTAEMSGDGALAAVLYERLAPVFQKSGDARLARFGGHLAGMARRLTLVGKTMKVEGKLIDGAPFDWSTYRGKVVLVEFWATWCPPCREELPHIKESYELYHDKGFDVVGVSLDSDKKQLEEFISHEKIPWPILFNDDSGTPGGGHSLADYYGITGIPTAILVNREGKVITLTARGEILTRELERLLGKVDGKAVEKGGEKSAQAERES